MFIITTRITKKKIIAGILIAAAVMIAIILLAGTKSTAQSVSAPTLSAKVKNNDDRVEYLTGLGWEVQPKPLEEQQVLIPQKFNEVYTEYNELQKSQGFDLEKYSGKDAMRYSYKVLNYPNYNDDVVLDILVYKNKVIAGDVQSVKMNGFMEGLKYPRA